MSAERSEAKEKISNFFQPLGHLLSISIYEKEEETIPKNGAFHTCTSSMLFSEMLAKRSEAKEKIFNFFPISGGMSLPKSKNISCRIELQQKKNLIWFDKCS